MEDFVPLIKVGDMSPGTMKIASVEGREYLVARVGDEYLVSQSRCTHLGSRLDKGDLEGTVLTCPRHHSQFDLRDGHVVRWTDWQGATLKVAETIRPPRPLKVYSTKVEGADLLVGPEITAP